MVPLPKLHSGPFNFVSAPRSKAHKRTKPVQPLPLTEWMLRYRQELAPGKPFDLESHAYLKAIYAETAQRMVVCKSGQAGVSEYLISYALHACDQRNATVLYVFPTDGHVSDFSAARMGTAIESSDYLGDIVVEGKAAMGENAKRKRGSDRITLKRIRDRFLYFRGGQVKPNGQAPQLKSIDADVLILDEWDEIDQRAPDIARKRLGHSVIAEERAVSTPTYAGRGIHAEYQASDRRQWHVRCRHCGQRQPLTIQSIVTEWDDLERPVMWHGKPQGRAFCACERCGKELDRLAQGEWVAEQPQADVAGYHISKLFSPLHDPLQFVLRLQSVNETVRRECFNQDLGLPYKPRGGGLDDAILDACRRNYGHSDRQGGCYMGVDVGRVLHVVVRGRPHPETGERPQLYAQEIPWSELEGIWRRYRPVMTVIDAMPETTKAREFQQLAKGRIWLAYYANDNQGMKDNEFITKNKEEQYLLVDRTRSLDKTLERFFEQENTLPADAKELPNYYAQMKAPVRVIEQNSQRQDVAKYVESSADHYCHAENYCTVASLLSSVIAPLAQGKTKGWGA